MKLRVFCSALVILFASSTINAWAAPPKDGSPANNEQAATAGQQSTNLNGMPNPIAASEPLALSNPVQPASAGCFDAPGGGPTDAMCIYNNGFVGIGTTSPAQNALQVVTSGGAFNTLGNGVHLGRDSGGNAHVEIVSGGGGIPYIDFLNDNLSDFDARIMLPADNILSIHVPRLGLNTDTPADMLDVNGGNVRTNQQFISTIATGTAPLSIISTTKVTNLNADSLDDRDESEFALLAGRTGGQQLSGGTAASESLTLDSTSNATKGALVLQPVGGNVGIGIAAPLSALHVVGDARVSGKVISDFVTSNSPLQLQTGGVTRVYIDDVTGNVGVPSTTPGEKIDVTGNVRASGQLISIVPIGTPPLVVTSTDKVVNLNADSLDGHDETDFALLPGRAGGQDLHGGTAASENLTLDSTANATKGGVFIQPTGGNVGVGTTAPTSPLHVVGDAKVTGKVITDFVTSNSPLQLQTGGVTRVFIDDVAGNVGIGTLTPGERLDVVGNIRTDSQLVSTVSVGTAPLAVTSTTKVTNLNADLLDSRDESEFALLAGRPGGQKLCGSDSAGENLTLDSTCAATKGFTLINPTGGNVGIGTTQPSEALEVIGCIKATCIKSSQSTIYQVSPLSMVKFGNSALNMLPNLTGTMTAQPTAAGPQFVMVPVAVPNQLLGAPFFLNSIRVCYKVSSGASYINRTSVRIMNDSGSFTSIVNDPTTRSSTTWNCYTIPAGAPQLTGPLYITFDLTAGGSGAAHNIEIGKITLDLIQ